ncbi:AraC family transcriptional regulator [Solirubrobacter ginsenosidimutans]|uniref:AraC family transcriptional regulator n=1 Tax=Solirubrobacter ginsenosidimutans TaxID=490573 RepID=A0A9X3S074_9ACTN|nr:AraC family transcriptional regulator [Solirubrobacter ginsenosidimutans]MDA0161009.1 AraC family transcriptional regulator [Solirubrobacter ginsenosidimutans]
MDVLADLLSRARASGAVFARTAIAPDHGIEFSGRRLLAVHTILSGDAYFERDDAPAAPVSAGDVVLLPEGTPYRAVPTPGARATPLDASRTPQVHRGQTPVSHLHTTRIPGSDPSMHVVCKAGLLCGAYTLDGLLSDALLEGLPPLIVVRDAGLDRLTALVADELAQPGPGEQTVLDRALDLLLVLGLRAYFTQPGAHVPGWYAALDDPGAGPAVRAIHADPRHRWTVAELAARAGLSRAAFAKRFTDVVGEPPLAYLTGWRMALAAQALRERGATVKAAAAEVGYTNEFAFATAFRRHYGEPPGRFRASREGRRSPTP